MAKSVHSGQTRGFICDRFRLPQKLSAFALLTAIGLLAACAARPETGFLLPVTETAPGATVRTLFVATTRERDARPGTLYNGEGGQPLHYAAVSVSIPQNHAAGEIEWPINPPGKPTSDFVVRQAAYLEGEKEFVRTLNTQLAKRPRGSRKVFLFIHGFNTMFAEGLYRFAQVVHDSEVDGGSRAIYLGFARKNRRVYLRYQQCDVGPRRP